ncbi:pectate lyase [Vibrio salinus]|uniref:pectate lyase n=1 Tax=Vibrio salinus TaxID=2899784 RepID=UPI001E3D47EE|nr:pectate lyase [Vibrio salinus]MCE0496055.1 pectate lyase [Vibrio salinus]
MKTSFLPLLNDYYQRMTKQAQAKSTPLLADGIDVHNGRPVYWAYPDGSRAPMSNFASQQNFMRGLVALSEITGNAHYREQAHQLTQYFLEHYSDPKSGLFHWGGHRFINRDTGDIEGPAGKACVHELKHHFPFYDLLHQVSPEKTTKYLQGFWAAHVSDWHKLDLSRHGEYGQPFPDRIFHQFEPHQVVDPSLWPDLPETVGLTFVNASTDLIYAACHYYKYTGDSDASKWAKHLYHQFVLARNPETLMPVYQFSSPKQREPEPEDDRITFSWFGDRARRQFGKEFGAIAREANVLFRDNWPVIIDNPLAMLECADLLQDDELTDWVIDGINAYFRYAWDESTNEIIPMWNNGQDMTGYVFQRDGYYGDKGTTLKRQPTDPACLLTLVRAGIRSDNADLRTLTAKMFASFKLGRLNAQTLHPTEVAQETDIASPYLVFSLLELEQLTGDHRLYELAENVGENLIREHYFDGYFLPSVKHRFARLDDPTPYALIALEAARKGCYQQIPVAISTGGYLHGEQKIDGEIKIVYDLDVIYQQTIEEPTPLPCGQ